MSPDQHDGSRPRHRRGPWSPYAVLAGEPGGDARWWRTPGIAFALAAIAGIVAGRVHGLVKVPVLIIALLFTLPAFFQALFLYGASRLHLGSSGTGRDQALDEAAQRIVTWVPRAAIGALCFLVVLYLLATL
jgi:hypothetical protein